jgi:hypothetical protein
MNNWFKFGLIFCLLILQQTNIIGQETNPKKWWVLPVSLIGLGIASSSQEIKNVQSEVYQNSFNGFHTSVDNFLQYSPTLINIGLSVTHPIPEARNAKIGRFVLGTLSYTLIVQGLKRSLLVTRPNGGEFSFPSGHTATAFFGAHLLAKEFGKEKPFLIYLGYGLASSTALLRMANNEHWLADVLVGAGIGISAAEFSYYLYPKLKAKWKEKNAFKINPILGNQYYALQMSYSL